MGEKVSNHFWRRWRRRKRGDYVKIPKTNLRLIKTLNDAVSFCKQRKKPSLPPKKHTHTKTRNGLRANETSSAHQTHTVIYLCCYCRGALYFRDRNRIEKCKVNTKCVCNVSHPVTCSCDLFIHDNDVFFEFEPFNIRSFEKHKTRPRVHRLSLLFITKHLASRCSERECKW